MEAWAAVATAPGRVEYQRVSVPAPGPQDVVVRVTHSWISNGTEGSFIRGERIAGDTPRGATDPLPFPHVSGYQKVGLVESVGAEVDEFAVGDRVFASVSAIDGMFYGSGGHISPAVTHRSQVWRLPDGLDPVTYSGLVLTQVGYNAATRPALSPGDATVVLGDGLVGHWSAQTLQQRGARVLMLGRHDERLERLALGPADGVVNVTREDPLAAVRAWAPDGVQALVHTAGTAAAIVPFVPLMRHDGQLSSAGFAGHEGLLDIQLLRGRELTLHTPAGWNRARMDATLDLVARGALTTTHLITHRFPAARAAEAFDLVLSRREPVLGVILDWE